ncbi:MAG: M23 family metallopeptidase [Bacteroidetes bacterium]|nr:M23 family metallopeptidase [Bacteroidota bacterium]MBU1679656.1 M23 family metallopeptidase [Bacteroidota bacterium]MBU2505839.1 M23 family metallopeptidase [Bacteroidota bacterium]
MKIFLLFVFILANISLAQEIKFHGEFSPGNIIIAESENILHAQIDNKRLDVHEGKIVVFGFDRDDRDSYLLRIKLNNGKSLIKKIELPARAYKIQRINNMKQSLVTAPPSQNERIVKERQITSAAREKIGELSEALYSTGFERPVMGGRVTSIFGSQRILNGTPKNFHNGLDIAAPEGTPVYAMADGFVRLAADTFYYAGNNIILDHGQGLNSSYLHLSRKDVREGEYVKKGQKIGEIGTTGRSTGSHLHWSLGWFNRRIDPECVLKIQFN